MWLAKYKKSLIVASCILVALGALYLLSIYYLLTNGFRHYDTFCSRYIPQIEAFKTAHGVFPKTILDFEKPSFSWRYDAAECNYIADPDGFSFQISDGFIGVGIYLSNEKRWVYD